MARLLFKDIELRELKRQCLHHNVFPVFLGHCMDGEPPSVHAVLKPIVDDCLNQLVLMSFDEVKIIVDSLPAGLRQMVEPLESPLIAESLIRVAEYCVAAELQKKYSPVSDVIQPKPHDSEVLDTCPELKSQIDNDGLLILGNNFVLLDGAIQYKDYLLHYHQFLRRGFSSNPNFDFLGKLARYRLDTQDSNTFRIAIDHRRIMKFDDFRQVMELDTWYGPQFASEKLDDPTFIGLTVVGRIYPHSLDSYPLEKTEFFWKTNEGESIKTLEIEELSSPSNPYDNWHINRYIHAERDIHNKTFRHFDGAAKVYAQHNYCNRLSHTMPQNDRPSHYIKLFRIDGAINLNDWVSLVSMFYKGNEMVIEYFDPKLFNEKYRPIRERTYRLIG